MEVQPSYLFQLEDGGSLSIAVHSDVPQYERFCEMIHANRGFVVEDASSADFCIVSLVAPGADGIAEELRAEGKLAIQDYWIRDSIDAERLLPWYPYQIAPPPSLPTGAGKTTSSSSTTETEDRDIHELVIMSARYWPLFSLEELHRYASRKCPHRSATSFKHLYETHQVDIEGRVSYLRGRLDNALGFNNDFSRRPRMSFGSPNKHIPLAIQAPPSSTAFASSSAVALMPTPTATSGSRGDQADAIESRGGQSTAVFQHEIPYEPPNIDNSPTPSISPATANTATQQQQPGVISQNKEGSGSIVPAAAPAPAAESALSVPVPSTGTAPHPGASGIPVTAQDKQELAKFLFEHPKKATVSFETHVELLRKTSTRAQLRSAASWKYVNRQYGGEIRKIINRMTERAAVEASKTAEKEMREGPAPLPLPAISLVTPAVDRPVKGANRHAPYKPKRVERPPKKVTDEDKQALALWMEDHPKDTTINTRTYFELFAAHHDVNKDRTTAAWEAAASRHKNDIAERRRKIILERKGKGQASKPEVVPSTQDPGLKGDLRAVRLAKKSGGNLDDADSELSSIESDLGN